MGPPGKASPSTRSASSVAVPSLTAYDMTWFLRPNGFFLRRARWAVVSSARPLPELAAEETAT